MTQTSLALLQELLQLAGWHLAAALSAVAAACLTSALGARFLLRRQKFRIRFNAVADLAGRQGLVFLLAPFIVAMTLWPDRLSDWPGGPVGLGWTTMAIAASFIMMRRVVEALAVLDRSVIEAARGLGLKPGEVLAQVELPMAGPKMLNAVRETANWCLGITTLLAVAGAPTLGRLVLFGPAQGRWAAASLALFALMALLVLVQAPLAHASRSLTRKVYGSLDRS